MGGQLWLDVFEMKKVFVDVFISGGVGLSLGYRKQFLYFGVSIIKVLLFIGIEVGGEFEKAFCGGMLYVCRFVLGMYK